MVIKAEAITPSDTASLNQSSYVYVGSSGDVAIVTADDDSVTVVGAVGGTMLGGEMPIHVKKVLSTNTTASNMLAIF